MLERLRSNVELEGAWHTKAKPRVHGDWGCVSVFSCAPEWGPAQEVGMFLVHGLRGEQGGEAGT